MSGTDGTYRDVEPLLGTARRASMSKCFRDLIYRPRLKVRHGSFLSTANGQDVVAMARP
ncbi:hypothetical protein PHIN109289_10205 [Phaeobacter inhibens]